MMLSSLIKDLEYQLNLTGDLEVIIATDEEGNSFHKFGGYSVGYSEDLRKYYVEYVDSSDTEELEDYDNPVMNAICLWP